MVVGVMVMVVMEMMTLVMQGDQEHWPNRQIDGTNSGFWILVGEIRGLSKPYNIKLIGHLQGDGTEGLVMIDLRQQGRDNSLLVQPKSCLHQNLLRLNWDFLPP